MADTVDVLEKITPRTSEMPAVDAGCHWCGIKLRAVPTPPEKFRDKWWHPDCLEAAQRLCAV